MNDSRSRVEIHPKKGIKMDMIVDNWIRRCIGITLVLFGLAGLVLAAAPLIYAMRWW
jgi:hypothetical protein